MTSTPVNRGRINAGSTNNGSQSDEMASKQDTWSEWFNVDTPRFGANDGDYETLYKIQRQNNKVCSKEFSISAAQCRRDQEPSSVFDKDTPESSQQDVFERYCTTDGLICRNEDQVSTGLCHNYNIRFRCHYTGDNDNNDAGFPQFDVRIYIILAVVPILIFLVRILWSYVFRRRRQRRRNERRARRRLNAANGEFFDDDSSSVSSGVANPPPSYQDLFGKTGQVGARSSIFAISRENIPICAKCESETCSVASIIRRNTILENMDENEATVSGEELTPSVEPELQSETRSTNENKAESFAELEASGFSPPTLTQEEGDVTVIMEESKSSSGDSLIQVGKEKSPIDHEATTLPLEDKSSDKSLDESNTSDNLQNNESSLTNMEQSDPTLELNPALLITIDISQPCPCPCHRTIPNKQQGATGCDNHGYNVDSEDVEANRRVSLPGMHIPVFGVNRMSFDRSVTPSVVAHTELPSYDLAVELIKKHKESETGSK